MAQRIDAVLQPTRTTTGWKINIGRMRSCISFVCPYISDVDVEWWRLYGDARNYGGQKSVLIAISNINIEAIFNGCDFQSPMDCWPVHIFYGSDSRLNLQLNIGADGGESGYLNDWAEEMFDLGHEVFVSSDMFANALLGGGLDPKSDNNFSLYTYETAQSRSEVGSDSGLRSEVNRKIEREHPESLLPSVPTKNFVPCDNHMFCRLTEHLLVLRVMSCLNEEVEKDQKDGTLTNLIANINTRGVRGGNFQVKFDGPKLEPITL